MEEKLAYEEREKWLRAGAILVYYFAAGINRSGHTRLCTVIRRAKFTSPGSRFAFPDSILAFVLGCILLPGLKVINPKVLLSADDGKNIGKYAEKDGFYWVNPFCTMINLPPANHGLSELRNHF